MAIPRLAELIGQPGASEFLRGVVASGRVGNAYLFHGPAGVGKCTAALAFARALMCGRNAPPAEAAPCAFVCRAGCFNERASIFRSTS